MELHAIDPLCVVPERTNGGIGGMCDRDKSPGAARKVVAMAHPHIKPVSPVGLNPREKVFCVIDPEMCRAVFPPGGLINLTAQLVGHKLKAVANSQDGDAKIEDLGRRYRGAVLVCAVGAPGEDQALRFKCNNLVKGDGKWMQFRVDAEFAHSPRDELGILRTVVKNKNSFGVGHRSGEEFNNNSNICNFALLSNMAGGGGFRTSPPGPLP